MWKAELSSKVLISEWCHLYWNQKSSFLYPPSSYMTLKLNLKLKLTRNMFGIGSLILQDVSMVNLFNLWIWRLENIEMKCQYCSTYHKPSTHRIFVNNCLFFGLTFVDELYKDQLYKTKKSHQSILWLSRHWVICGWGA